MVELLWWRYHTDFLVSRSFFEQKESLRDFIITEIAGTANLNDTKKKREIIVTNHETGESKAYLIPYGSRIKVSDGAELEAGDELTEGSINPHDILRIKGIRAVQDYMIQEVQRVYRLQGVEINDKHIEVIVRQMLKKIRIEESGDTEFLPGTNVDRLEFEDVNEALEAEGKEPAIGEPIVVVRHEGFSCNLIPSCQPLLSRDNKGSDRGSNQRKDRSTGRSERERNH